MAQPNLPNLICLHGALGAASQLESALQPLHAHAQLHFLDFPGHGSKSHETLSIDACLEALRQFVRENNLAKTPIFGYSMGGYVALLFAVQNPDLCGPIITLGTKLNWNTHFANVEIQKLKPEIITQKVPKYAALLQKWHRSNWPQVVKNTAELMRNLGENPRLHLEDFEQLQPRIAFCIAANDNMVTREETIQAAWLAPKGEFAEIPNSQHPIEKTDLKKLETIVQDFL